MRDIFLSTPSSVVPQPGILVRLMVQALCNCLSQLSNMQPTVPQEHSSSKADRVCPAPTTLLLVVVVWFKSDPLAAFTFWVQGGSHRFIELLNASNKSTHMLCISRKLRSFWTEWYSYHICLCSRMYILNNLIHQLHNMFHFTVHQGAQIQVTDSWYTHWLGIQDACTGCQNVCATAVWMSLKVGIVDSMHGKTGERVTKLVAACDKKYTYIYIVEFDHEEMFLCSY